jgi:cell division protein FtsX
MTDVNEDRRSVSMNMVSRVLPYALMAFVGAAGWSMNSPFLLSIVVLGTMGIAIGTAMMTRPQAIADQITELNTIEHAMHDHQQASQPR